MHLKYIGNLKNLNLVDCIMIYDVMYLFCDNFGLLYSIICTFVSKIIFSIENPDH